MNCPRCHAGIVYQGNWPACDCDAVPDLMLTVREAARYLFLSRGGVCHLIRQGLITASTSKRPARIAMTSLKAYLAAEHAARTASRGGDAP